MQLRALARRRKFARGETVFHQGDPGDVLHLVEDGRFAVEVLTPLGHRMVIRLVGPGEHFGELALTSEDSTRNATLIAIEASTTLAIHRRDFEDVRKRAPAVDRLLVAALAERVKVETETAMELAFVPVDVRMYRRLLTLSGMYGPASKTSEPVVLPFTQEMLAGLAGTTRATANRAIRALEKQGILELRRGAVVIHDMARLRRAATL